MDFLYYYMMNKNEGFIQYIKIKEAIKAFEGIDIIPINDDKEYQYMAKWYIRWIKISK